MLEVLISLSTNTLPLGMDVPAWLSRTILTSFIKVTSTAPVDNQSAFIERCVPVCLLYGVRQIVANGAGSQMPLHAGSVPSYFHYPAALAAGCIQPGTQPHLIQPPLCNGAVKFVLQPTATIPVAPPPPPLCITSLVLTPVTGFQGKHCYCYYYYYLTLGSNSREREKLSKVYNSIGHYLGGCLQLLLLLLLLLS